MPHSYLITRVHSALWYTAEVTLVLSEMRTVPQRSCHDVEVFAAAAAGQTGRSLE